MKFENTQVWGFEHAMHGMRNPKNSWNRNDTYERKYMNALNGFFFNPDEYKGRICRYEGSDCIYVDVGPNDMKLAQTLIAGGSEHRKFMRQIFVSVDITAPLYWWKEFDTYKVGTTANSTSTMHKLTSKPITLDCFEIDDFDANIASTFVNEIIEYCETLRSMYLSTQDRRYWKELVRWLPESWLQTRTVTLNYENLRSIFFQRKTHKLNEWSGKYDYTKDNFIKWIMSLPYATELITWEPIKPKSKKEELVDLLFANWDNINIVNEFRKFGVEVLDENKNFRPILDILDDLSVVWTEIDKT